MKASVTVVAPSFRFHCFFFSSSRFSLSPLSPSCVHFWSLSSFSPPFYSLLYHLSLFAVCCGYFARFSLFAVSLSLRRLSPSLLPSLSFSLLSLLLVPVSLYSRCARFRFSLFLSFLSLSLSLLWLSLFISPLFAMNFFHSPPSEHEEI